MHGSGCPYCCINKKSSINDFIKKSQEIHGKLKYDYNEVKYINTNIKVKIKCNRCGKSFWQTPSHHLQGCGCPYCNFSKGEIKIQQFLENNNILFNQQKRFKDCKDKQSLPFDFYLPTYNMCIEYQGEQHYNIGYFERVLCLPDKVAKEKFNILQNHDQIKRDYCKANNIQLIEIKYNENIEEKLSKLLLLKN